MLCFVAAVVVVVCTVSSSMLHCGCVCIGSVYAGQALECASSAAAASGLVPFGYGELCTKDGFRLSASFKDGKSYGWGLFTAPSGDLFYGCWNREHKRHGKGYSIKVSDASVCVEEYEDGRLLKKTKRRPPALNTLHWLPPLNLPGGAARHRFNGDVPAGHAGHSATVTRDGILLVIFGGEVPIASTEASSSAAASALSAAANTVRLSNDVYMLDVSSGVWVRAPSSSKASSNPHMPPPMHSHTATLIEQGGKRQLVIIGGQVGGIEANSNVYVLDIDSGEWQCVVSKGLSFMGHTATYMEATHEIWVIVQSSVFVLNVRSWEWREVSVDNRSLPRRVPRSCVQHSAVAVGTMIYVFGGIDLTVAHTAGKKYERVSADVRILHTERLCWEAPECTAPVAPATAPAAAAAASSTAGDYTGFARGGWDVGRSGHTATLVGRSMYVMGGWTAVNPNINVVDASYLNDVQVLDVETLCWQSVAEPLPLFSAPRAAHTATLVSAVADGKELLVYGGRNSANPALADFRVLHLPSAAAAPAPAAAKPAVSAAAAAAAARSTSASAPVVALAAKPAVPSAAAAAAPVASFVDASLPADSPALLDADSAGSGFILDAFLHSQ